MRRPIGIVRVRLVRRGRLVWGYEGENLFVNSGLPALAALLGGDTTGQFAAAVGFGSGSTAPTPMLARKTIAPIVFGSGMSISGTWTLTF